MRFKPLVGILILVVAAIPVLREGATGSPRQVASVQSSYPETADGLKSLVQDLFSATKARDKEKTSALLGSFGIPNHTTWFLKSFGSNEGPGLDGKYIGLETQTAESLKKRIEVSLRDGRTEIGVTSVEKPEDTQMRLMKAVLAAQTRPTTIYLVSLRKGADDASPSFFGDFIYTEGGFRYLDRQVMMTLSTAPAGRLTVGGNVQHARLVKEVAPQYPPEAAAEKISGTVSLRIVVGTDGKVLELRVIKGHPLLAQAALDAVRQWVYQRTLLNGTPVEVETTVDVAFQH